MQSWAAMTCEKFTSFPNNSSACLHIHAIPFLLNHKFIALLLKESVIVTEKEWYLQYP
jgi:hypothetical protein